MTDFNDLLLPDAVLERRRGRQQEGAVPAARRGRRRSLWARSPAASPIALTEREKLGSTGFGGGVAIPHAQDRRARSRVVGVFARLAQPIDFHAVDDLPVDLVFMLLSPPDAGAEHLKALARVSRRLRDRGFVAKLRGAGSRDALYALLTADEARDAA